ncbi:MULTISPECIES: hypothetical protein [unclassified Sphingomonas]|uniref:hypothetical protein n=1 Tax=unclassified Sphingomonas TaxID=196159 RepID=UPI000B22E56C|nr:MULTISPECIES: hypothetical protein [unclassified Sphingomonas]
MTAIGLIVGTDSVHLISDGALCGADGVIQGIASKVAIATHLRMAIVGTGRINPVEIAAALPASSQDAAMRRLPSYLFEQRRKNAADAPHLEADGRNNVTLLAAIWADDTDRAEGWIISTGHPFLGPDYVPYTLCEVEQVWMPQTASLIGRPDRFRPQIDGSRILNEQRRIGQRGRYWVGGFGEATTVTVGGVTKERLCEWPDIVGAVIDPPRLAT